MSVMALHLGSHLHNFINPTSHEQTSTSAGRAQDAEVRRRIAEGIPTPRIAILGAGAAGICMALQLLEQGITSFTLYEKADRVGGPLDWLGVAVGTVTIAALVYAVGQAPGRGLTAPSVLDC